MTIQENPRNARNQNTPKNPKIKDSQTLKSYPRNEDREKERHSQTDRFDKDKAKEHRIHLSRWNAPQQDSRRESWVHTR